MGKIYEIRGGTNRQLKSIGITTSAMKNIMAALDKIDETNGNDLESDAWKEVKKYFENFGFRVVYDRNMAILTAALFAAIAESGNQGLTKIAANVLTRKITNKKGTQVNLGQALLNGDGETIYKILVNNNFKLALHMINIGKNYTDAYLSRMKKITPWHKHLTHSIRELTTVQKVFEDLTHGKLKIEGGSTETTEPTTATTTTTTPTEGDRTDDESSDGYSSDSDDENPPPPLPRPIPENKRAELLHKKIADHYKHNPTVEIKPLNPAAQPSPLEVHNKTDFHFDTYTINGVLQVWFDDEVENKFRENAKKCTDEKKLNEMAGKYIEEIDKARPEYDPDSDHPIPPAPKNTDSTPRIPPAPPAPSAPPAPKPLVTQSALGGVKLGSKNGLKLDTPTDARNELFKSFEEYTQTQYKSLRKKYSSVEFLISAEAVRLDKDEKLLSGCPSFTQDTNTFHYTTKPAANKNTNWFDTTPSNQKVKLFILLTEEDLKSFIPDNSKKENLTDIYNKCCGKPLNNVRFLINNIYEVLQETQKHKQTLDKLKDKELKFVYSQNKANELVWFDSTLDCVKLNCFAVFDDDIVDPTKLKQKIEAIKTALTTINPTPEEEKTPLKSGSPQQQAFMNAIPVGKETGTDSEPTKSTIEVWGSTIRRDEDEAADKEQRTAERIKQIEEIKTKFSCPQETATILFAAGVQPTSEDTAEMREIAKIITDMEEILKTLPEDVPKKAPKILEEARIIYSVYNSVRQNYPDASYKNNVGDAREIIRVAKKIAHVTNEEAAKKIAEIAKKNKTDIEKVIREKKLKNSVISLAKETYVRMTKQKLEEKAALEAVLSEYSSKLDAGTFDKMNAQLQNRRKVLEDSYINPGDGEWDPDNDQPNRKK